MTAAAPAPHRVTNPPASAGGAVASPATGTLTLAAEHFAAATLYLAFGAVGLLWIAPELAQGAYPSPHVAGVTHLFTLGWLTTTVFGALSQLLPVALGAPVRSTRLGHVAFATFAPGAGLFACGVADGSTVLRHVGIALVATGVLLAAANFGASLRRARTRDVTWAAVAIALGFLVSTLTLGLVLLHNLHTGFIAAARLRVLAAHLHVAVVGWAIVLMVGVSHRLLPMFLLAHGADTRWTRRSLAFLAAGVVALAVGLVARVGALVWVGAALLEAGIGCFVWQAWCFYRVRVRRRIDVGMRFAAVALGFLVVAALLGPAVLVAGPSQARLATAYVLVGLLGGVVLYVVGFFYKIVPLLAWTARYAGRAGAAGTPTVADMYSSRVAHAQLAAMAAGVAFLGGGALAGAATATRAGALLFVAGVALFVRQIARIAFGGGR